jgi:hypothetical protein
MRKVIALLFLLDTAFAGTPTVSFDYDSSQDPPCLSALANDCVASF